MSNPDSLKNTSKVKTEQRREKKLIQSLSRNLKNFFQKQKFRQAVVGLSGGLDSAVVAALASQALGAQNITGLILPVQKISSPESSSLAQKLAHQIKIPTRKFELSALLKTCQKIPWPQTPLARQNLIARLRMLVLFNFANTQNALVLGTSNRSEIVLGYGTKFGDFAADVEVLGNLWKTQVRAIAPALKIPPALITRPPTAELAPNQTDAHELTADYQQIDPLLRKITQGKFQLTKKSTPLEHLIFNRVQKNQHKTQSIPIL